MDYEGLLDRAIDEMPDFSGSEARLTIPDAQAQPDGAFTRLTNLAAIADALARDPEHLHRSIQRELGTNGQFKDDRARYNGTFTGEAFDAAVSGYVDEFVTCSECGLPDTRLTVEERTQMLRCEACGAFRPVAKPSATAQTRRRPDVEEGRTYEVKITGTGRKGDGVAEKGQFTIFVPGTQPGDVVDVLIESVSGTLAFARQV